jgi:hypothetical protein
MWQDQNGPVTLIPDGFIGFVYEITNTVTGKRYIGKKLFYFSKTKQVKGKKKRIKVESDWKDYYGSNDELLADVEKLGKDNFKRVILHYCKNKGLMTYIELREQIDRRVLEDETYYNKWIMARVTTNHIKALK